MKNFARLCFAILFLCTAPVFADDVRVGLVSYWPLDTINGSTTPDLAFGNDLNLVNISASNQVAGVRGTAIVLDGSSQYLTLTHSTSSSDAGLPIYGAGAYTITFWVKGAAGQNSRYVFSEGSTASDNPILLFQGTSASGFTAKLDMFVRTTGGTGSLNHPRSATTVFDNTWHHVAWVDNNGAAKLYIDGNLDATSFNYTRGSLTMNTTTIGALVRAAVSGYFAGSVDDVAIWERALSQTEIQSVVTNGIATPIPVFAPAITNQPASVTKNVGDWTVFSVGAIGKRPFSYQWYKNGSPISGATAQTYRVSGLTTNNSGEVYSVEVTNPGGTTLSTNATLTVLPDPAPNLSSGLVSYWPFDTVTNVSVGTNFATPDLYGRNDMALNSMDTNNLVAGRFGSALSFDATLSQYCNRVGGLPIYNNPNYSVSLWVKGNGITQDARRVYSEGSTTAAAPLFTLGTETAGTLQTASVFVRNDANSPLVNGRKSTNVVFDDSWHHMVWVDANGQGKLYIDGVLDDADFTYTRSATTLNTTSVGAVLRSGVGNFYTGLVDEVATWNRILSLTEIQQLEVSGVPVPVSAVPPSFSQPPSGTNILSGADFTLSAQAIGTSPLSYQWTKDGANVIGATSNVLALPNIQVTNSGSYRLIVTNVAGAITSAPAVVNVTERPLPPSVLGIDFDHRNATAADTQSGFQQLILSGSGSVSTATTALFGGVEVTVAGSGSPLDTRIRTEVINTGDFTLSKIFQDFVFATATSGTVGLDVTLKYLATNQLYSMTIWSFDSGSTGNRISDWTANGTQMIDNYTFNGSNLPTNDAQYSFSFNVAADATGKILLQGRRDASGSGAAVFLNALKVQIPPPQITTGVIVGNTVSLTYFTPNPEVAHVVQATAALGSTWGNVTGVSFTQTGPYTVKAEFPLTASTAQFYRISRTAP